MLPSTINGRETLQIGFVLDCTILVTRVGSLSIILLTLLSPNLVSTFISVSFGGILLLLVPRPHCTFFSHYSLAGGWVGLSEITNIGGGNFLVIEHDNRAGPDAAIKHIYNISLGDLNFIIDGENVTKTLYRDILPDVSTAIGGLALEKVKGMALLDGDVWINTDNDGTNGTSSESRLINLGKLV